MKKIFLFMIVLSLLVLSACTQPWITEDPSGELRGNVWLADSKWHNHGLSFNALEFHPTENIVRYITYDANEKYPNADEAFIDYEYEYFEEGPLVIFLLDKAIMDEILLEVGMQWKDIIAFEHPFRSETVLLGELVKKKDKTGIVIGKKTYWKTDKKDIDSYVQRYRNKLHDELVKLGLDPSSDCERLNFPYIDSEEATTTNDGV